MTVVVPDTDEIVAALVALGLLREVAGATGLDAAIRTGLLAPAAYVLPASETSEPAGFSTGIRSQTVTAEFGVVLTAHDVSPDAGRRALVSFRPLRAAMVEALMRLRPAWATEPLSHVRGQLVAAPQTGGVLVWEDTYRARLRRSITES